MANEKDTSEFNLSEIVKEVADSLVSERRKGIAGLIKVEMQRAEQLASDVKLLENQLKRKAKKLEQATAKIARLRDGDWSVLNFEAKNDPKGEND